MTNLAEAIQDMKSEVLSGLAIEAAAERAARDYDLNPKLVMRKFQESYPTGVEGLKAFEQMVPKPAQAAEALVQSAVERACKIYNVDPKGCDLGYDMKGNRITIIGQKSSGNFVWVSHRDGGRYRGPKVRFS